jgi:hypothetical protein
VANQAGRVSPESEETEAGSVLGSATSHTTQRQSYSMHTNTLYDDPEQSSSALGTKLTSGTVVNALGNTVGMCIVYRVLQV